MSLKCFGIKIRKHTRQRSQVRNFCNARIVLEMQRLQAREAPNAVIRDDRIGREVQIGQCRQALKSLVSNALIPIQTNHEKNETKRKHTITAEINENEIIIALDWHKQHTINAPSAAGVETMNRQACH
jgi:hypothetical protein